MMKGRQKHVDRLKILADANRIVKLASRVVYTGADMIRAHAYREISRGAVSGKNHVAADAGSFPNRDTGVLQAGLRAELTKPLVAEFSSNAPYASAVEGGSNRKAGTTSRSFAGHTSVYGPSKAKHGPVKVEFGDSTTAARPYMRPSRDAKADEIQRLFATEIDKLVRKSG